ncbi:aldehyde dehydrogenase [Fomitiporia mediterranea MF3/22]|uniref:aldehyde dehydrogenase n=1 Tax=Fomitiporia mediterranea (strain MF3/22) TaxID=694068 RepID=UPI00044098F2|nr:aldehyde dehydrogenase [Fomitiporia mediterranea MF3/22]EJD01005.1 aldehyde dehydrogenase [Fomitiporia mediterranea MF3/22]
MRPTSIGSFKFRNLYVPYLGNSSIPQNIGTAQTNEKLTIVNPADGEEICSVLSASKELVDYAVRKANEVFSSGVWSRKPAHERSIVLSRLARALEARMPDFVEIESMQTGRAIREMAAQVGRLPEWLDYYAALLRTREDFVAPTQGKLLNYVKRVPLGVVAQITPFNHPLLIAVKKLAPALAAGNSVIVKPSELAPISVLEFAQLASDSGLPDGVLTVLPGLGHTTGKDLCSNPSISKVDITGGTKVGRELGSIVSSNLAYYTAELGGKAPIVMFNDADLEMAVNGTAFAAFVASGQTCVSGARIIVHENIYDKFMSTLVEKTKSITQRIGNPLNPKSSMGTIISMHHLQRIADMVNRTSGTVLLGGNRLHGLSPLDGFDLSKGSFFAPTIVTDIDTTDELWQEEIFGPVIVVKTFSTEEEGIRLANDCKYGLGAGIWTSNLSRAHRVAEEIQAGLVWVNTHHRNDPSSPWGGMKQSGVGRENGLEAYESYTQSKSIIVNIASTEESRTAGDWFAEEGNAKRYG